MEISSYHNKYFSILGDSISTLDGYNPPENAVYYDWEKKRLSAVYAPEDTWWGKVIDTLGGKLLVNNAWSGSLVCKHPDCEIESYGCSNGRTSGLGMGALAPDVVMILMGLNDFGWAMHPTPAAGEGSLAVFSVAYETMLEKIKTNYPNAEIWCLTLPVGCRSNQPNFTPILIRGGWHLEQYCQVIRNCAAAADCKLLELYDLQHAYDTVDGYHPNAAGMQTIASAVLEELRKVG